MFQKDDKLFRVYKFIYNQKIMVGVASLLVEAIPTRNVSAKVKNRIGPHHST